MPKRDGIIHGKSDRLSEDLRIADGQSVEVQVTVVVAGRNERDGIARTAGAFADDTEWDDMMKEVHQARKLERQPLTA